LNYNWNVYKIFKNGRRAKAPIMEFACSEGDAHRYFKEEIKKKFSERLAQDEYRILRADLPQERLAEASNHEEEQFIKDKNRVLGRLLKGKNISSKIKLGTGLIFSSNSEWKWQWAGLQSATNKYITGLSPTFDKHSDAMAWMNKQISLVSEL